MKKIYFLILFFAPLFCFAQSNFKHGYVVSLKGDTLTGDINYRQEDQTPALITFKQDIGPIIYNDFLPNGIKAFGVDGGEEYVSATISTDYMRAASDNAPLTKTVFLRVVAKGPNVLLYEYARDQQQRFYIKDSGAKLIEELIYQVHPAGSKGDTYITTQRYRSQLSVIAQYHHKNPSGILRQIFASEYLKKDLVNISELINEPETKKNTVHQFRYFAGAGITYGNFQYSGEFDFSQNPSSSSKPGPRITVGTDYPLDPKKGRLFIRAELSGYFVQYNLSADATTNAKGPVTIIDAKRLTVSFSPQLIYYFYTSNYFKAFLGAGVSFDLSSYPSSIADGRYTNAYTYSYHVHFSTFGAKALRGSEISVPIKAGVLLSKKIELNAAYVLASPLMIQSYPHFEANAALYQLGINYLFK